MQRPINHGTSLNLLLAHVRFFNPRSLNRTAALRVRRADHVATLTLPSFENSCLIVSYCALVWRLLLSFESFVSRLLAMTRNTK